MAAITPETLTAFVRLGKAGSIRPDRAIIYAVALQAIVEVAELSSTPRLRHFMAQIAQESGGFRALVESTAYRDAERLDALFRNVQGVAHAKRLIAAGPQAIGNTIYAHKLGNGGIESGDGYRYRGRGFMMITGRGNYREMGRRTGMPLESEPELLGEAGPAAEAAAKFWSSRQINQAADADDIEAVTLLVNGRAKLHLDRRQAWLVAAERVWPS